MPRLRVIIEPRAQTEIRSAAAWWEDNRKKAPGAIFIDLRQALDLLRASPTVGMAVRRTRTSGLRKYFLERVGYDLYYRVVADEHTLVILAFWHARRRPPPL